MSSKFIFYLHNTKICIKNTALRAEFKIRNRADVQIQYDICRREKKYKFYMVTLLREIHFEKGGKPIR